VPALRRTLLLCLLAALLAAPAAHAADATTIIRDCEDDGQLEGSYTPGELRNARQNLPTDIDEYSDCRDVLARAAAAAVTSGNGGGAGSGGGSGGGSGSGGSGGAAGGSGGGAGGGAGGSGSGGSGSGGTGGGSGGSGASATGRLVTPQTAADAKVVADAAKAPAPDAIQVAGKAVVPGTSGLAAGAARHDLPVPLLVLLALLGLSALLALVPAARRRVLRRRAA
jgi:hypothetical protein